MFVKRFIAHDMPEAIRKINSEFGPEAVILENKSVRQKGISGLFKKKMLEVVAAYEPNRPQKQAPKKEVPPKAVPEEAVPEEADIEEAVPRTVRMVETPPRKDENLESTQKLLGRQVQELKDAMQDFTNQIRIVGKEKPLTYSSDVLSVYNGLIKRDVQEDICKEIAAQTQDIQSRREVDAKTVAQQLILDRLGDPTPLKLRRYERNVLLFMGPTGAGKTTTLAKLAGRLKFKEHLSVGMINTDTYRVGAMEHIRIYSEIMDIPALMAYTADELAGALKKLADNDIVLIDTAGKNPKDPEYQQQIQQYIEVSHANEVFLVLSVVTGSNACRDVIRHYSFIKDYKLIITKLDEVGAWGNVLNIADFSKKGISYVTNGQNVPDDIRDVDTYKLVSCIVGDGEICYD